MNYIFVNDLHSWYFSYINIQERKIVTKLKMTNATAPATAELIAPLGNTVLVTPRCGLPVQFTRNEYGVIIDSFGDVSNARQCVTVNVTAHKTDEAGFIEQEIVRLTVPLTGPVKPMINSYIGLMLADYTLNDWCVWPGDESYDEPF